MLARREGITQLVAGLVALLIVGLTMLYMLWQVVQGMLTLGDLALIYQALTQGQNLMRGLLQSVGEIYENSLFSERSLFVSGTGTCRAGSRVTGGL